MNINELHNAFKEDASKLGDYARIDKTTLANGYCDADEALRAAKEEGNKKEATKQASIRSAYFSALMVRYWYKIFDWMQNSSSLNLAPEDFVNWLSDSLYVAFYYRFWRYEYKAEVKKGIFIDWQYDENGNKIENPYYYEIDPTAVDKIINRCCGSMRGRVYQFHNKDKRKINVQSLSIDQIAEDAGDSFIDDVIDDITDSYESTPASFEGAHQLVLTLLNNGEGIEALIVDGIANRDAFKTSIGSEIDTKYDDETGEAYQEARKVINHTFNERKLVHHLNSINKSFMRRFCEEYAIEEARGEAIYDKLQSLSNYKLYNYVKKTLLEIKEKPDLLNCLYN